jgi:hypothetical protein
MCSFPLREESKVHVNIKPIFSIKLDDDVYSVFSGILAISKNIVENGKCGS